MSAPSCPTDCGRCETCQRGDVYVDLTPTFRAPMSLPRDGGESETSR
ncbi:hypothetical protein [Janibacter terrae]